MKSLCITLAIIIFSPVYLIPQSSIYALDDAIIKAEDRIETSAMPSFRNLESFLIWYEDELKYRNYYNNVSADTLHQIQSQTKSIVSLLFGIAIDKGFVDNEYALVSAYFPEYFSRGDSLKSLVTICDLLTMSAGFKWEEMIPFNDPLNDNINMNYSGSYLQYALSRPMAAKPSTEFKYSSGSPMIVAGIIEKTSKMPLDKFAEKYLFGPLNIKEYRWIKDSTGFCHAGGGLFLKPEDILKIGILVLNQGRWKGDIIISESWIRKSCQPCSLTTSSDFNYGYFWWIKDMKDSNGKTIRVISAQGAGGQNMYIIPDYNLIVSFTESNYGTPLVGPLIFNNYIFPALLDMQ